MKMIFKKEEKVEMVKMVTEMCCEIGFVTKREFTSSFLKGTFDLDMDISEFMSCLEDGKVFTTPDFLLKMYMVDNEYVIEYESEVIVMIMKRMNKYIRPFTSMVKSAIGMIKGMVGFYITIIDEIDDDVENWIDERKKDEKNTDPKSEPSEEVELVK